LPRSLVLNNSIGHLHSALELISLRANEQKRIDHD